MPLLLFLLMPLFPLFLTLFSSLPLSFSFSVSLPFISHYSDREAGSSVSLPDLLMFCIRGGEIGKYVEGGARMDAPALPEQ